MGDQVSDRCEESAPGRPVRTIDERRMCGSGLRAIFDAAVSIESRSLSKRMVRSAMAAGPTDDDPLVPFHDVVQQAHASLMGNELGDPTHG
jgi:hypothetical protein